MKAERVGVYHCISRVVAGDWLLDDTAKEVLRQMIWKVAAFSGVRILTYCVMSNHFHLLVRVDPEASARLDRSEILERYRAFYGEAPSSPGFPPLHVLSAIFEGGGDHAEFWERRLRARMGDVSEFMKTLKQRFTTWFNKTRQRFGTLWSERFKSLLVEDSRFAVQTVAAYIDLNPVRAGLVKDPAKYRWCGYGEAMAGREGALEGMAKIEGMPGHERRAALEQYRVIVGGKGTCARHAGDGLMDQAAAEAILENGGRLNRWELLRCRTRFLTDGVILGSREFVRRLSGGQEANAKAKKARKGSSFTPLPLLDGNGELYAWRRPRRSRVTRERPVD